MGYIERSPRQFLKKMVLLLMHSQSAKSLLWISLAFKGLNLTETNILSCLPLLFNANGDAGDAGAASNSCSPPPSTLISFPLSPLLCFKIMSIFFRYSTPFSLISLFSCPCCDMEREGIVGSWCWQCRRRRRMSQNTGIWHDQNRFF